MAVNQQVLKIQKIERHVLFMVESDSYSSILKR